jgi:pimeloyl-ACP methyl ester carboxylesterase
VTAVFVHGNPETPAVWDKIRAELARDDVVAVHLPGFGTPCSPTFDATKESYVSWLLDTVEALASVTGPVDLVGHDWGGALVLRVASTHPHLLRSWVTDVAGLFDPDYEWHGFAQVWQTPGAGELDVEATLTRARDAHVERLVGGGITRREAEIFADAYDAEMGRCILALYRSAAQPAMRAWAQDVHGAAARPGMVLAPADDPFTGGVDAARRVAERVGARVEVLDRLGHWWMLQDPLRAASVLRSFWASVDRPAARGLGRQPM